MAFEFIFLPEAEKQLRALDRTTIQHIIKKLQWLEKQKDPFHFSTPLHNKKIGCVRFRIGDYRVITKAQNATLHIEILAVGHRREIYR